MLIYPSAPRGSKLHLGKGINQEYTYLIVAIPLYYYFEETLHLLTHNLCFWPAISFEIQYPYLKQKFFPTALLKLGNIKMLLIT